MKGMSTTLCFLALSCFLALVHSDCIETEVNFDFNRALPQTTSCQTPLPRTPDAVIGGPKIAVKFGALVECEKMPILTKTVTDAYNSAVDTLNELSESFNSNIQFSVEYENTRLNASYAAEKMKLLVNRGANTILGPLTADELVLVSPLSAALGVTTISTTAQFIGYGSMKNVFRMVPSEEDHANTIANYLVANGIYSAVAVFRGDSFGIPFKDQFQRAYQNLGGNLSISLSYNPLNFNGTSIALELESRVTEALNYISFGPKRFGVVLISLEEWQGIVEKVRSPTLLRQFWMGSSGVSRVREPRPSVLEFARLAGGLRSVGIHIPPTAAKDKVLASLRVRGHNNPDPVAYLTYDAVVLAGTAVLLSRTTANPALSTGFEALTSYWVGGSGRMTLNNIGERLFVRHSAEQLDLNTGRWVTQAVFDPIKVAFVTNFNTL